MTRSPNQQLITDAVVAQYIHDISRRHPAPEPEPVRLRELRPDEADSLEVAPRLAA